MNRPDGNLITPEKETGPLSGRRVLVTGGATGTGLATSVFIAGAGGEVIVGTRSQDHYNSAAERIRPESISPFIVDLTQRTDVESALGQLVEANRLPTDVVLSAAGGMEPFMRDLMTGLVSIRRASTDEEKRVKAEELVPQIEEWVEKSLPFAEEVNFLGPLDLLNAIDDVLPQDPQRRMRVISCSSLPSSFFDLDAPPSFYRGVAKTKARFERWIENNWQSFARRGIYLGILSSHGIRNTNVVAISQRYLMPLLSDEDQAKLEAAYVDQEKVTEVIGRMLTEDISLWQNGVRRLYLIGDGVYDSLKVTDPQYVSFKLPI